MARGNTGAAPAAAPKTAPVATATVQVADLEAQAQAADASAESAPETTGLPATYSLQTNTYSTEVVRPAQTSTPVEAEDIAEEEDAVSAPTTDESEAERFSLEEARKLRRENARYRTDLKAVKAQLAEVEGLREKLTQLEEASLGEQERQIRRQERLESQLIELKARETKLLERENERRLEIEVIRQARNLRIVDEDAAFRLMDRSDLEFDDNGHATNVDQVLRKLIKDRGYLVAREETRANVANPQRQVAQAEDSTGKKPETNEERRLRIFGRGGSMWSNPRGQGGGVIFFDNAGASRDRS